MTTQNEAAVRKIESLPDCYSALKEHLFKYVSTDCLFEENDSLQMGRNVKVAPEYFMFRLYPPAQSNWLTKKRAFEVPLDYLKFLSYVNGCFAYSMSLYGFPPSMEQEVPLLNRKKLQCHDLTTANTIWIRSYRNVGTRIYIGGRHYSHEENSGYFMDENGAVIALLQQGEKVGEWPSFSLMLQQELPESKATNEKRNLF